MIPLVYGSVCSGIETASVAIGNSMPVNVMRWIGRRIELVKEVA